jgi:hypothetical protein
MSSCLIIFGASSHVLRSYAPRKSYDQIYVGHRQSFNTRHPSISNYKFEPFLCDLHEDICFEEILNMLSSYSQIDIIFASYTPTGLGFDSSLDEIAKGILGNCIFPLRYFAFISKAFPDRKINAVFISSIYAHVSPNPSNYKPNAPCNPLFYGVAKAGVEQGIRWLSCQNTNHIFNSIALGPLPKNNIVETFPLMASNLIRNMPSQSFVESGDLYKGLDFLLSQSGSVRGITLFIDGGYTIW